MGNLRTFRPYVVPPKSFVRTKCKVKGDVKGINTNFLCSEPCAADWDEDLVVTESLGELKRGRTPHVNIELRNTSQKKIRTNMLVGEISVVSSVLPLKLFNSDPCKESIEKVGVMKVKSEVKCEGK